MHSCKRLGAASAILLGLVLAAGTAPAQPGARYTWSLEARLAAADAVVVGTIAKVERKVLVVPGGPDKAGIVYPDGQFEYAPAVKTVAVLKGNLSGVVDDLQFRWSLGADHRYEQWQKAGNTLLWFLGPMPKHGRGRSWYAVTFGKEVPGEARFGGRREPPLYASDFTILKDQEAILERARGYAKTSTRVLPLHAIRYSGPWHYLMVPIEPALEKTARRLITSPQEFVQPWEKLEPRLRYTLRFSGVEALRHFKSAANIALLRSLLDDPLEKFESSLVPQHPVGGKAFEVLLGWGVDAPLPKSLEAVTQLDLADAKVTDAALERVAAFKNLTTLKLSGTQVSDRGLRHLSTLEHLERLTLRDTRVTDAGVAELRRALPHCKISR